MKINLFTSAPALLCLALASCYPIKSKPRGPLGPEGAQGTQGASGQTVTSQSQQKIQDRRDELKKKEETAQQKKEQISDLPKNKPTDTTAEKPTKPKGDYAFANPVPGKAGFVFSPFNNKLVDVRDIPSGTLVQDPTYPASEKKYFRVP